MLLSSLPDPSSIDNKRLENVALAHCFLEGVRIWLPAIVRRRDRVVLPDDLVDRSLFFLLVEQQVVTTGTILRFDDNQDLIESQQNVGFDAGGETRPEPAVASAGIDRRRTGNAKPSREGFPCLN